MIIGRLGLSRRGWSSVFGLPRCGGSSVPICKENKATYIIADIHILYGLNHLFDQF
jgi:hypothetical protein